MSVTRGGNFRIIYISGITFINKLIVVQLIRAVFDFFSGAKHCLRTIPGVYLFLNVPSSAGFSKLKLQCAQVGENKRVVVIEKESTVIKYLKILQYAAIGTTKTFILTYLLFKTFIFRPACNKEVNKNEIFELIHNIILNIVWYSGLPRLHIASKCKEIALFLNTLEKLWKNSGNANAMFS